MKSQSSKILLGFSAGTLITSVAYSFSNDAPSAALRAAGSVAGSIAVAEEASTASIVAPVVGSVVMDLFSEFIKRLKLDSDETIILGKTGSMFIGSVATYVAARILE